jgi:mannose-6-phosphate isomerase-like protein (cupin superfamily)
MNTKKIVETLTRQYPGRAIILNNEKKPTEILCEAEPTDRHPAHSVAIAVIDKSMPHKHLIMEETYTVIRGELTLHVNDEIVTLKRDESHTIEPGAVHWAEGDETWVECLAKPGWTKEDHYIL